MQQQLHILRSAENFSGLCRISVGLQGCNSDQAGGEEATMEEDEEEGQEGHRPSWQQAALCVARACLTLQAALQQAGLPGQVVGVADAGMVLVYCYKVCAMAVHVVLWLHGVCMTVVHMFLWLQGDRVFWECGVRGATRVLAWCTHTHTHTHTHVLDVFVGIHVVYSCVVMCAVCWESSRPSCTLPLSPARACLPGMLRQHDVYL